MNVFGPLAMFFVFSDICLRGLLYHDGRGLHQKKDPAMFLSVITLSTSVFSNL